MPPQAEHAVRSLQPAEVHIVLTVRDMASLLPAEWQETVKHRNTRGWQDWLGDVIDRESVVRRPAPVVVLAGPRHPGHPAISGPGTCPPERIHVIMIPPPGSGTGLLWQRFAGLLGVDPDSADLSVARPNTSSACPRSSSCGG